MLPISIRAAAPDDVPTILAIEQAAPGASHWTVEQYGKRIQSDVQDACFIVAECEGKVCGFLCAWIVAGEWEIENVVVGEEFRCRRVGAELMRALIAKWDELAGAAIFLEVRESNAPARALYAKFGLREVGRRREYYRGPPEDAILYARRRLG